MSVLNLVSIVLVLAGVILCAQGFVKFYKRRLLSGFGLEISGLLFLSLAAIVFLLASNLHVYQRLVYEEPVAEIVFHQIEEKKFSAKLTDMGANTTNYYILKGDEWQLDARILVWHGYASLLGLDSHYQLHRLSGRYSNIEQEKNAPRSVHALYSDRKNILWEFLQSYQNRISWLVDATYGNAVFLPMTDSALYKITISQRGLIVRPGNDRAREAVSRWIGF